MEMGFPQDAVDVLVGQQVLLGGTVGTAGAGDAVGPDDVHSTMAAAAAAAGDVIWTADPAALAAGRLQRTGRSG